MSKRLLLAALLLSACCEAGAEIVIRRVPDRSDIGRTGEIMRDTVACKDREVLIAAALAAGKEPGGPEAALRLINQHGCISLSKGVPAKLADKSPMGDLTTWQVCDLRVTTDCWWVRAGALGNLRD